MASLLDELQIRSVKCAFSMSGGAASASVIWLLSQILERALGLQEQRHFLGQRPTQIRGIQAFDYAQGAANALCRSRIRNEITTMRQHGSNPDVMMLLTRFQVTCGRDPNG